MRDGNAGCVLFRDPADPRDVFSLVPPYLREDGADELGWFSEYGPGRRNSGVEPGDPGCRAAARNAISRGRGRDGRTLPKKSSPGPR